MELEMAPITIAKPKKKDYSIDATKCLSNDEWKQLVYKLDQHRKDPRYKQDVAFLYAALYTGARASEVLNLRRCDLLTRHSLFIRGLKGSRNREIPIPEEAYWTIHSHLHSHAEDKMFTFTYRNAAYIWALWRPVKKGLHSLRHTFAVRLYDRTRDLRLVQVALGHKNIQNTMVYAEYVYQYKEMRTLILGRGRKK